MLWNHPSWVGIQLLWYKPSVAHLTKMAAPTQAHRTIHTWINPLQSLMHMIEEHNVTYSPPHDWHEGC